MAVSALHAAWQGKVNNRRPNPALAFGPNAPSVCLDQASGNGKTQTGPAVTPRAGLFTPVEALEDMREILLSPIERFRIRIIMGESRQIE